jgi:ribosomal protein S25
MTTTKRGRPRPKDVIVRDAGVRKLLEKDGPMTRNQVAERTGLSPSLAYLALTRLKETGQVKRCLDDDSGESVWTTKTDVPCP